MIYQFVVIGKKGYPTEKGLYSQIRKYRMRKISFVEKKTINRFQQAGHSPRGNKTLPGHFASHSRVDIASEILYPYPLADYKKIKGPLQLLPNIDNPLPSFMLPVVVRFAYESKYRTSLSLLLGWMKKGDIRHIRCQGSHSMRPFPNERLAISIGDYEAGPLECFAP